MDAERIKRLRACYESLAPRADQLVERFYQNLFAAHPEVRPMFPEDMSQQSRHFLAAFSMSIEHLDNPEVFRGPLQRMGVRHQGYGVRREHYPWVCDAVVAAIQEIGGGAITPEIRDDWREALGLIADVMMDGLEDEEDPFAKT